MNQATSYQQWYRVHIWELKPVRASLYADRIANSQRLSLESEICPFYHPEHSGVGAVIEEVEKGEVELGRIGDHDGFEK